MRKKSKLVFGIGANDYEGVVMVNGKPIKSYYVWVLMLQRCYDSKFKDKNPAYIGCTVSEEWHKFSTFKTWFDENYRFDLEERGIELALDKDLLGVEKKIYSPETCIFIPKRINLFMTNKKGTNKSGHIGVSWYKKLNKWKAQINDFDTGKPKHLGYFTDIEEASQAYVNARVVESEKAKSYMRELGYSEDIIDKIK